MTFKKILRKFHNYSSKSPAGKQANATRYCGPQMQLEQLEPRVLLSVSVTDLNSLTALQLAQSLVGSGVQISNASFTGANVAGGSFIGGLSEGIGIESGVILSSGNITNAIGPNNSDSKSSNNSTPGDSDLNSLITSSTNDAAVLEFDFVPTQSTISFQYVFASEEYNEYVDQYNDVFGFFVNSQNIALIPGTSDPVTINNVNNGDHPQYYRDNDYGDFSNNTPYPTQFDGFTSVLQAVAQVTTGTSTHIKLAIADAGDSAWDSAVFLSGGSFVSSLADVSLTQTVSDNTVQVGETFVYTITATNNTAVNATGVSISDTLPAGIVSIGASSTQGVVSVASNTINASLGTLTPGQSATVYVTAQGTLTGTFLNSPFVSANEYDPDASNNTDTDSVTVSAGSNNSSIHGTVWNDTDSDGAWDLSEVGLGGVLVYLDANLNSTFDGGEAFTVTNTDNVLTTIDESGTYSFYGLTGGNYSVKQILPIGFTQTAAPLTIALASSTAFIDANFGDASAPTSITEATISGVKFLDLNGNGIRDGGLIQGTQPDAVFVIDVSGSTTSGFKGTPVGDMNSDGSSNTILDAEIAGFIALNQQLIAQGFGSTGNVSIVSFGSSASALDMDPATAGTQLSTTPTADNDGNGVPDVEQILKTLTSGGSTNYEAALQTATNTITSVGTTTGNGNVIFLSDGEPNSSNYSDEVATLQATGVNIRAFGVGTGAKLPPLQIIDPNAAIFTSTNELLNVFSGAGGGGGTTYTENGMPGVTIYLDLNNNGALDSNEPATITAADGSFSFTGLTVGQTYYVREILPTGYQQTAGPYTITLTTNGAQNMDFGNMPTSTTDPDPDTISGWKFNDLNGNGVRDVNEPGLADWEIFLDANGNNTLDPGEEYTLTEDDGYFEFFALDPGTYNVAEVVQTLDWNQTYPGSPGFPAYHTVTLVDGSFVNNILFGNHEKLPSGVSVDTIAGVKFDDVNGNGIRDGGLIQGTQPDAVFVIDVSGSTSGSFLGTPVGDLNGDGKANTILDAEIAGFIALNQQLIDLGFGSTGRVSIVRFNSSAQQLDMNPLAAGSQLFATPSADADSNGELDVVQALKTLILGGGTNYEPALELARDALTTMGSTAGNNNVIFLSDGEPNSLNYSDEVADLLAAGANVSAFGVGSGAKLSPLQQIDSNAAIFTSTNELLNVFSGSSGGSGGGTSYTEGGLAGVTIFLDLNNNGTLDTNEPFTLTATDGSYSFTGLDLYQTYTVREIVPTGYVATTGPFTVEVGEDQTLNVDFGNTAAPEENYPDLEAKSLTASPSGIVVPGDKVGLSFIVTNVGQEIAKGPVNVYFYASTDSVLDAQDSLIGSLTNKKVDLDPGEDAKPFTLKNYVIPADMLPDIVTIFATVEAADASINEVNLTNNTTSTDLDVRWRFGSWDEDGDGTIDRSNVKLSVNDTDGTLCTFTMSGAGYGELNGPNFMTMTLNNSTIASKVAIKTNGGTIPGTTVQNVTADGDLGDLKASTTNLGNSFSAVGQVNKMLMADAVANGKQISLNIGNSSATLKKGCNVAFHKIKNLDLTSTSALGTVTFAEWLDDGTPDDITAPSIIKLESKGDKKNNLAGNFQADALFTDTSSTMDLIVNGLMQGASVKTAGSIKGVKLAAALDSNIFAGINTALSVIPTSNTQIINNAASINSVKMGGKLTIGDYLGYTNNHSFSNSVISSPTIGSVSLIGVERYNSGQEHGIAGTNITSVKVKQPDGVSYSWSGSTNTWKTIPAGGWQDFDINIL
ncbi:MAG: choice-of-anchor L domain-containing protein [Sedimentisphaerales bacterium]|nr:choice-of-anchor L domain-containing protein [Sedimentisphaerales bacterium]